MCSEKRKGESVLEFWYFRASTGEGKHFVLHSSLGAFTQHLYCSTYSCSFFFFLSLFFLGDLNLDGIELGALKGYMSSIVKRDQCIHEKRVQSYFSSVHLLSRVRLFDPWIAARQASLPSPSPGVHSDSRPSSPWCHPAISSWVVPLSSCPQSLPASESFPMSELSAWYYRVLKVVLNIILDHTEIVLPVYVSSLYYRDIVKFIWSRLLLRS